MGGQIPRPIRVKVIKKMARRQKQGRNSKGSRDRRWYRNQHNKSSQRERS
jgi:hypothetical protein